MQLVEQSLDELCQALGLPGFATDWVPDKPNQELRVLLLPTFHPEVCLEFAENETGTIVNVTCAQARTSPFEPVAPISVDRDTGRVVGTTLSGIETALRNALVEPDGLTQGRDGMDINIFWRTLRVSLIVQHANSAQNPALGAFVAQLIAWAHNAIKCNVCKACLAEAGVYVELDLARPVAGQ